MHNDADRSMYAQGLATFHFGTGTGSTSTVGEALAGLISGVLAAKKVPGATLPGSPWLWVVLGCAVGVMGVALRWWTIRTLGKQFTRNLQIAEDHRVVVEGPYRRIRHPSYSGAILMFAGVGLGLGNALSLVACLGV